MLKRDHIMKQAEALGKVLEKFLSELLRLRSEGRSDATLTYVAENAKDLFSMNINETIESSDADFQNLLQKISSGPEAYKIEYIADFLNASASAYDGSKKEKDQLLQKSLIVYEYLNKTSRTFSAEREKKINELKQQIK